MAERECMLRGLAGARNQDELFGTLDHMNIGAYDTRLNKTLYICLSCIVGATVKYPDVGETLDGMGLNIKDGRSCVTLDGLDVQLSALAERFPDTEALTASIPRPLS